MGVAVSLIAVIPALPEEGSMTDSSEEPRASVRLRIHGRVQGVGYRYFAFEAARRLGLVGFVKNEPDGTVSLEAEGPKETLAALVATCKKGPPGGRVTSVELTFGPSTGAFVRFEILR